ncbi:MAG: ClpXP protease specificity-enhancing factor SspB [Hyphomicrobiales bacterium]
MIRYDVLAQDALRGMLRKLLGEVAQTGLPGEHHFFVTFSTTSPGVRISNRLKSQYPEEMTIVLQHQFWDLMVNEHAFEIGLSFNAIPERLHVPFMAIKAFYDPSVQFGLQFDPEAAKSRDDEPEANDDNAVPEEDRSATVAPLHAPRPMLPSEREKQREEAKRLAEEAAKRDTEEAAKLSAEADNDSDGDFAEDFDAEDASDTDFESDGKNDDDGKGAEVVSLDAFRKKN